MYWSRRCGRRNGIVEVYLVERRMDVGAGDVGASAGVSLL